MTCTLKALCIRVLLQNFSTHTNGQLVLPKNLQANFEVLLLLSSACAVNSPENLLRAFPALYTCDTVQLFLVERWPCGLSIVASLAGFHNIKRMLFERARNQHSNFLLYMTDKIELFHPDELFRIVRKHPRAIGLIPRRLQTSQLVKLAVSANWRNIAFIADPSIGGIFIL